MSGIWSAARTLRPSWDDTWLAVADAVGRRSLCDRAKIGAVIVDPRNRVVAVGYNGPPAGFDPRGGDGEPNLQLGCLHWCPRAQDAARGRRYAALMPDYTTCPALHAEANALSVCDRSQREGGKIYTTGDVCFDCAKLIANSGLTEVVVRSDGGEHRNPSRSYEFLESCGVTVVVAR